MQEERTRPARVTWQQETNNAWRETAARSEDGNQIQEEENRMEYAFQEGTVVAYPRVTSARKESIDKDI